MKEKALMEETALPVHPRLTDPRTGEPLRALGFYRDRPLWPMMGGSEEEGAGDAGADGDEGTDGEGGETGSGKEKGEGDQSSGEETVPLAKFKKLEKHLSNADRRKAELEAELQKIRDKDLPEAEKTVRERDEAIARAEKAEGNFGKLARQHAFLLETQRQKIAWVNPEAALKLADLEDLDIDDRGRVDGIVDAVKALVKNHKYLVATSGKDGDGGDEGGDDADGKADSRPRSGAPVGGGKRRSSGKKQYSDEELYARFPALRK